MDIAGSQVVLCFGDYSTKIVRKVPVVTDRFGVLCNEIACDADLVRELCCAVLALMGVGVGIGQTMNQNIVDMVNTTTFDGRDQPVVPPTELDSVLEHMLNGVAYCHMLYEDGKPADFRYLYTNPAFHKLTGIGEARGRLVSELIPGIREADATLFEIYGRVAKGGPSERFNIQVAALQQWFSVSVYSPKLDHFVALFDVITELKRSELALQESETQLRFVLDGSELGFWDWDIGANKVDRNERWATILGYTHAEIQHTTQQWSDFIHPDDRERAWKSIFDVIEGRSQSHKLEYRMLHKDGSIRWILDQAKVMQRDANGRPTRMCGTHTDITERKTMEEELVRQARVDYLTGTFNRRHFMVCAELERQRTSRYGGPLSMLMLDIDHFKGVNDRYGHKVGDLVLQKLAELCRYALREVDMVGRMGGEEFAVLLPQTDVQRAVEVAERLRELIAQDAVLVEGTEPIQFKVSIGVTCLSSADDSIDTLLQRADHALYDAKNAGRNRVCVR